MKNTNQKNKIILTYIDEDNQYRKENVWVKASGAYFQVDSIPFFAKNISLGDIVSAEEDEGLLYFLDLIKASEHSTIQIIIFNENYYFDLINFINQMNCSWEEFIPQKYVSVDIPPEVDYAKIKIFLDAGVVDHRWDYREACLGKHHRGLLP